jgi:hypothetical protein
MRKLVWIAPFIALLVWSCTGGDDAVTPGRTIAKPESAAPLLTIDDAGHAMTVTDGGGRQLSIRFDTASRIQYLDCGGFHIQGGPGWFFEWTSRDFLAMEFVELGGGRRLERYNFNGRTLELEILGQPTEAHFRQFREFYETDPSLNSLEANPDGAAMAELLENARPLLLEALRERSPEGYDELLASSGAGSLPPLQLRPKWADVTCGTAAACAAVKCLFGGATNYGCVVCTAVKFVCAIMDLFGWW